MSESPIRLLRQFSDEIVALAEKVVASTAIVTGQTRDLFDGGGSAWLYDAEHLVTNHHVVENLVETNPRPIPRWTTNACSGYRNRPAH